MTDIQFNEAEHIYTVNQKRVLSVTQYLELSGSVDTQWFKEEHCLRGSAVHKAIQYHLQGDLDDETLHPLVRPHVDAGREFIEKVGFRPTSIEKIVYDPVYGFIGTLDMLGTWDLCEGNILIDWKSGAFLPCVALQTAAYESCLSGKYRRFAVKLGKDGKYTLSDEFKDRNDIKIFRSKVASVNWNIKNGTLNI